ncbi:hypothetical protein LKI_10371 (plasmid) [Leuconostoc kimchii IMSNU 11154]|uniref:DNA methylase N-4/N-6 domain-containing protein n=1 Tax=Leuconostoc kimchii (strain IMSNU 11154 / KCTC 2386 / IH25) TaxID=762051 RepID=D5SZK5_LEUKI|nr:DNA methyltransferase [Leuconostoc kimchii]ADG39454.1 hypothetical protein LKI_10371 [Leuconostoc kimchii IMSNU 11154]
MPDIPEKINLSNVNSRQVNPELLNELRDLFFKAEEQKERYDFTWNGKAKSYFEAAAPTTKTLRAQPEESVNFEKSENLFITGDNLEALKLLQESYLGKIDMIYIDPPYNTGKDFVYQDNFKKTQKENDLSEGIIDEEGNRLVKNEKSNGRYHSDWLTMMYPRLKLARNLLSDTGVIFVSIDDNEQANLKLLMDEIFGEDNFVNRFTWVNKKEGRSLKSKGAKSTSELIYAYAKNIQLINEFSANTQDLNKLMPTIYSDTNNKISFDDKGPYLATHELYNGNSAFNEETRPNLVFNIWYREEDKSVVFENPYSQSYVLITPHKNSDGRHKYHAYRWSQEKIKNEIDDLLFVKYNDTYKIFTKRREFANTVIKDLITDIPTNQGTRDLRKLGINEFDFPKPVSLIKFLIQISSQYNSTILDFFAGSGTTAESVMAINQQDQGSRNYILITLDELLDQENKYTTIDQISRERIRRAAKKISDTSGFRALKVDSTGLKEDVFKTAGELDQVDLLQDIDNHSDNRSDYDLLYDVLVDGALEYNRPITIDTMNDEQIIKYDYLGELSGVVCYFGENLTDELTRQIATLKPLIAVFKESTFDKSAQKVNVMEQFRIISPDTKVKVI